MPVSHLDRRDFLTGAAVWSAASARRVYGANDRLRIGLIGCGERGTFDARLMRGTPEDVRAVAPANYHDGNLDPRLAASRNVEIAALCDVYGTRLNAARLWAPQARTYDDFRKLLADPEVDAVVIATPDHWHAQMLVLACDAGKDVYCEKPMYYRLGEGKVMIDAARRNRRIVQAGTQHRSADHIAEAARIVQSGKIGEVRFVRVWNYMGTVSAGSGGNFQSGNAPVPDSDPPPDLDWDAWLGPAPKVPFNRNRLRYRSFMDYTNGIITDYGNHRFDSVHQIMGGSEVPLTAFSTAVRFNKTTAGDIYDMQVATFEYPNYILNYEACNYNGHGLGGRTSGMRYYGMLGAEDRPHGMAFYGTEAALFVDRIGMELYPELKPAARVPGGGSGAVAMVPRMEKIKVNEDEPTPLHVKNFVDAVRERKEPFANIAVGVRATAVGCLGNVAYWTGRKLKWDGDSQNFPDDKDANRFLFRQYREPWDLVKMS
jgi:predicted dehydrogenase